MAGAGKPRPRVDIDNASYFEAASRGVFLIQRCRECRQWTFYPRTACPQCLSDDLDWEEPSGKGEVVSYSIVERPHHPSFYEEVPIVFAAIRLAEGPVMLSELRDTDTADLSIGMPVQVRLEQIDDELVLPVWVPR